MLRTDGDIYYVGLASSLRSRLADHLRDHHHGKWDQFDLYVIRKGKAKYLRELEALLIRVAKPTANKTEPKFVKHNNVTKNSSKHCTKKLPLSLFEPLDAVRLRCPDRLPQVLRAGQSNRERRERCKKWSCLHLAEDRMSLFLIGDIHGRIDEYLRLLASEDAKEIRGFAVQPFFED